MNRKELTGREGDNRTNKTKQKGKGKKHNNNNNKLETDSVFTVEVCYILIRR